MVSSDWLNQIFLKKKFAAQIWAQGPKADPQNQVFGHFLEFESLVFLEIAYNESLQ